MEKKIVLITVVISDFFLKLKEQACNLPPTPSQPPEHEKNEEEDEEHNQQ